MLSILSSLAESESVSISENEKWGIKKRFQNGTFIISYPPYGYDNVDGEMVIVLEQAEIVKQIFADTLAGKRAMAGIRKNIRTGTVFQEELNVLSAETVSNAEFITNRAVPMLHGAVPPI